MRMRALLGIIAAAVFLSCLLNPLVYAAIHVVWASCPWPFERVFNRVFLVALAAAIFSARRALPLDRLAPFFSGAAKVNVSTVLAGATLSFLISALMLPLLVWQSKLVWAYFSRTEMLWRMLIVFPVGILIGFIEESIFRVLLFAGTISLLSPIGAAVLSSAGYSVVHFFGPDKQFVYENFELFGGFRYFAAIVEQAFDTSHAGAMAGLFLIGLVLCYAIVRTHKIYLAVGLHAGWVLAAKLAAFVTDIAPGGSELGGLGRRYFLIAQPMAWYSLILVLLLVHFLTRETPATDKSDD